jgi:hypothetical protein
VGTVGMGRHQGLDYKLINKAAEGAYQNLTGQPAPVGNDLANLIKIAVAYLGTLGDTTYQPPTDPNAAIEDSLKRLNQWTPIPGKPDSKILAVMVSANHKACLTSLDGYLQSRFGKPPKYDGSDEETHYFVAYLNALGDTAPPGFKKKLKKKVKKKVKKKLLKKH